MAFYVQNISPTQQFLKISICNMEDTASVNIDLYIEDKSDSTSKIYILNNVKIPNGATLVLEREDLLYDYLAYDLYIVESSGAARSLNLIIN